MTRWSIRRAWENWKACEAYFAADKRAGKALDRLAVAGDVHDRITALWDLADAGLTAAESAHGFPDAGRRDEDGFTLAASEDLVARLVARIADTESALWWASLGGAGGAAPVAYDLDLPLGDDAEAVLTALRCEPRLAVRAELVHRLYAAVVDTVGGQAAEVLPAIVRCYLALSASSPEDSPTRTDRGES